MSDVSDINHVPAIRPIRPKDTGTERRPIPEQPQQRNKKQQKPSPQEVDDDGEAHIDEYA